MPFPCKDVIVRILRDHGGEIDQEAFLAEFGELIPAEDAQRVREQGRKAKGGQATAVADEDALSAGRRRYGHSRLGSGIKKGWLERERHGPTRSTLRLSGAEAERPPRRLSAQRAEATKARMGRLLPQVAEMLGGFRSDRRLPDACASLTVAEYAESLSAALEIRRDLDAIIDCIRKEGT